VPLQAKRRVFMLGDDRNWAASMVCARATAKRWAFELGKYRNTYPSFADSRAGVRIRLRPLLGLVRSMGIALRPLATGRGVL
jgi:hypothetical protein